MLDSCSATSVEVEVRDRTDLLEMGRDTALDDVPVVVSLESASASSVADKCWCDELLPRMDARRIGVSGWAAVFVEVVVADVSPLLEGDRPNAGVKTTKCPCWSSPMCART